MGFQGLLQLESWLVGMRCRRNCETLTNPDSMLKQQVVVVVVVGVGIVGEQRLACLQS